MRCESCDGEVAILAARTGLVQAVGVSDELFAEFLRSLNINV